MIFLGFSRERKRERDDFATNGQLLTKETKKDASEYFRDSFKGKNYWTKKLKPKYEHFSRACFLFILLRYKMHRMVSHPDNIRKNSKQDGGESAAVTLFATDFKLV